MHKGLTRFGIFGAVIIMTIVALFSLIADGNEAKKALITGPVIALLFFGFFAGLGWVWKGFWSQ